MSKVKDLLMNALAGASGVSNKKPVSKTKSSSPGILGSIASSRVSNMAQTGKRGKDKTKRQPRGSAFKGY